MYELVIFEILPAFNKIPSPYSSVPQLFDTTRRSKTVDAASALIKVAGTPDSPNPPTASVDPFGISATASAALS